MVAIIAPDGERSSTLMSIWIDAVAFRAGRGLKTAQWAQGEMVSGAVQEEVSVTTRRE